MKIYAIRDRLIDYFQQPWAAPGDKEVLTAIAQAINNEENNSAIKQAPHHFEIWRIGEVDEEGRITAGKEFLADCSSLVRGNLRPNDDRNERTHPAAAGNGPPGALGNQRSADERLAQVTARANGVAAETPRQSPDGVPARGYGPDRDTA